METRDEIDLKAYAQQTGRQSRGNFNNCVIAHTRRLNVEVATVGLPAVERLKLLVETTSGAQPLSGLEEKEGE